MAAVTCFLLVVIASSLRVGLNMNRPGNLDASRWALVDFRDNIYYPSVSFTAGNNPYDREKHLAQYPVRVRFPPYSPLYLLLHSPFAWLDHVPAQLTYLALTYLLGLALAAVTLRMCGLAPSAQRTFLLACLILVSRPGHWNLVLGQSTLEFVLAVYAAFHFGGRSPWLAGVAIAAATMKATIGVPLLLIMVCFGWRRSFAAGIVIAFVATVVPTLILINSAGGVAAFTGSVIDTVTVFEADQSANPVVSASRLDLLALFSMAIGSPLSPPVRAVIFAIVMVTACCSIRRVRSYSAGPGSDVFCFSIALLAILISVYQQLYSALLLTLPLTALVAGRWTPANLSIHRATRWILMVLLALPAVNQLVAFRVLRTIEDVPWLWTLTVSLNRVSLLAAFALFVFWALTSTPRPRETTP